MKIKGKVLIICCLVVVVVACFILVISGLRVTPQRSPKAKDLRSLLQNQGNLLPRITRSSS